VGGRDRRAPKEQRCNARTHTPMVLVKREISQIHFLRFIAGEAHSFGSLGRARRHVNMSRRRMDTVSLAEVTALGEDDRKAVMEMVRDGEMDMSEVRPSHTSPLHLSTCTNTPTHTVQPAHQPPLHHTLPTRPRNCQHGGCTCAHSCLPSAQLITLGACVSY
jgi:hypothetical protein